MRHEQLLPNVNVSDEMDVSAFYQPQYLALVSDYFKDSDADSEKDKRLLAPDDVTKILNNLKVKSLDFIEHVTGVFGQIQVKFDKFGDLDLRNTFEFDKVVYKDRAYSSDDIKEYSRFLRTANWSDYNSISQSIQGEFNSGVPLLLYAQRLYNGVPYSKWKNTPKQSLGTILGKAFSDMPAPGDRIPSFPITKLRVEMCTGKLAGSPHVFPFSQRKYNKTTDSVFNTLPQFMRMMLAQIWIFNSQFRNKNMILNWDDWDNIPEPFDGPPEPTVEEVKKTKRKVKTVYVDPVLGW